MPNALGVFAGADLYAIDMFELQLHRYEEFVAGGICLDMIPVRYRHMKDHHCAFTRSQCHSRHGFD